MKEYDFYTCDVFTNRRFGGNQLAVLPGARGLDDETMQKVAREFNYSETTFVTASENPGCDFRVRVFTPYTELPFAGHPTLGTAFVLASLEPDREADREADWGPEQEAAPEVDWRPDREPDSEADRDEGPTGSSKKRVVFEMGIGEVPVEIKLEQGHPVFMRLSLKNPALPQESPLSERQIASALSLQEDEIGAGNLRAAKIISGASLLMVPLRDSAAVKKAQANFSVWKELITPAVQAVYLFTPDGESSERDFVARLFAPDLGILEDPATGAAAAALGVYLSCFDSEVSGQPAGRFERVIEQGLEMGRPSRLEVGITKNGDQLNVDVGGSAVLVCRGEMMID